MDERAYEKIHSPQNKVSLNTHTSPIGSYVAGYHQTDAPGTVSRKQIGKTSLSNPCGAMQNFRVREEIVAHPTVY